MAKQTAVRGVKHRSPIERNPKANAVSVTATAAPEFASDERRLVSRSIATRPVDGLSHLSLEHLAPTIGTVVHGIDMANTSDEEVDFLQQLLAARKVIFFRDQHCTESQHIAFGARFGELEIHPFNPMHRDHDEIIPIYSGPKYVGEANLWHSDVMWRMEPSLGSILLARVVPEVGGDTLFADMTAAYHGLAAELRAQIDGLMAINSGSANGSKEKARQRLAERGATPDELADFDEKYAHVPIPVHPVVRTHPVTGERALYVNAGFTRRIVGLDPQQSSDLLATLYAQAAIPEYQCRFRWEVGSVAFWDNRSAQHYASSDYWPERRRLERVTVAGELPFFSNDDGERLTSYEADDALLAPKPQ